MSADVGRHAEEMVESAKANAPALALAGDYLNASRFMEAYGGQVRRSPELGRWYLWNGSWWAEDRLERVQAMAGRVIDDLRAWAARASGDEFARRTKHYVASAKAGRREALLNIVGADQRIVVSVEDIDAHPMLLACRNGTVDLATGELRPADHRDLLTRGVDVDYEPSARSERWESFLARIFADEQLVSYVQRGLGYCLTGATGEHAVLVFTGVGANGKSTLVGLVQDLLGDLAITAPEGLVIQQGHERHPERMAVLRSRRMVVSAELEQHSVLAESVVKLLSGGDTISARELYGRRFNFRPTHKLLLVTNHRPRVPGTDHAIWRRLRVVPFEVVIPLGEQDPDLRRRLLAEDGSAVLAWLVEGAVEWHRQGLGEAAAVDVATDAYRASQDTFGAWRDECTVLVDRARTKVGDLYDSWRDWCEAAGERPGRKQDFVMALEEHGVEIETYQGTRLTRGLALLVRAGEDSSRDFPISPPRGTLGTRPHETPPRLPYKDSE